MPEKKSIALVLERPPFESKDVTMLHAGALVAFVANNLGVVDFWDHTVVVSIIPCNVWVRVSGHYGVFSFCAIWP